jgi:hypothetical protein
VPAVPRVRYALCVIRQALVLGVASLSLLARDPGCSSVDSSGTSGANAPCTRDYDCKDGLTCRGGVCTGPSKDGGLSDGGGSTDGADDG